MKFDELQPKIGGFGRFQKIQFSLLTVSVMFIAVNQLDLYFQISTPSHRCQLSNSTVAFLQQSPNYSSIDEMNSVALDPDNGCKRRVLNQSNSCLAEGSGGMIYSCEALGTEDCLDGRQFGDEFGITVVTEFDLVCDQSVVATLIKSMSFVGPFIGGIGFGQLSDRVGRKIAFIIGAALMILAGVAISFSVNVYMFMTILVVRTLVLKGPVVVTLCLTVECADRKHRNSLAYMRNILKPVSQILVAATAYLLKDWRRLTIYAAAPQILLVAIFFFISESPIWLASKGRRSDLQQYAAKVNRINKGCATEAEIDSLETEEPKAAPDDNAGGNCCPRVSAIELIAKWQRLRFIATSFLLLMISGLSNSAIMFNTEKLSGNFYLNFGILGLSNAGSYLLGWLAVDRLGIVRLIRLDLLLGVVAMATVAAVPVGSNFGLVATVATQIGKVFLLNANNSVQIYGTQVFPTVARNLASGIIGVALSLGSLLAPFLLYIGASDGSLAFLPFLLVSALLTGSLLLALTLPQVPDRMLVTFPDFDAFLATSGRQPVIRRRRSRVASVEIPMGRLATVRAH